MRCLGDVAGRDVLEIGCGAGQCSRWVRTRGGAAGRPRPLRPPAAALAAASTRRPASRSRRVRGTGHGAALRATECFDVVFSLLRCAAVRRDATALVAEVARVLRPGGRVRVLDHPPDPVDVPRRPRRGRPDRLPSPTGTARRTSRSTTTTGETSYVEHHRTLGDWVRLLAGHGFVLTDLVEPEWPRTTTASGAAGDRVRGR